jgi:molecular chaperone GrpE (heat shock protein)
MSDEPTQLPDSENPHAAEFAVLEALKNEVENLKDQRLRALAEAENIRRRADKEKADASQYAVTKFARDMVGIADNFARALAAVPAQVRELADPSRWTPAAASSTPTCIRPLPRCRATASRRAQSWTWSSPAI